jgi:subtilisin family serine protease
MPPYLRLLSAAGFLLCLCAGAQHIHLRNEVIDSTPAAARARIAPAPKGDAAASGLFLIQFTGSLQPAWPEQLRGLGVELLRYVPDDAFVAKAENARPAQVKALPYVRWMGDYRADHKLHATLRGAAGARLADEAVPVSVLLSPAATPAELAATRSALQPLHHESHARFGAVLRGSIPHGKLAALAESPAVLWIEPAPKMKLFDEVASKIVAGDGGPHLTRSQLFGFDGSGVTVAVADSGLHSGDTNTMHPDLFGRVKGLFFYGSLSDASDEHGHGTHVTGIVGGNGFTGEVDENNFLYGLGVAPGVSIIAQRIFDGLGNFEAPPTYETLTRDAVRAGADIGSNSWGDDTQGRYDISAMEFDALVRDADELAFGDQQYILEFSAGNAGPGGQTIGSPAVAKNVIATGASQNDRLDFIIYGDGLETMADFSSRGPCEDGRIKPDVVAPGTWIASLRSPLGDDNNAWAPISDYYLYEGGTSQAGPHVSGAAAVLVQYFQVFYGIAHPSPALIKAALINCAVDMDNEVETGPTPNMDEGWGRVDLTQIVFATRNTEVVDQTQFLTNSQTYERRLILASAEEPLKITLAYTDVPGFPAAIPALVNDLDLEVVAPDGTIYRGNQFDEGESVPNAPAADNINNVEGIYLSEPLPGEYLVRVRARHIVQDARRETGPIDQDFALVLSGDIPLPGVGTMILDRAAYTAPGRIRLQIIDTDLSGQASATAHVTSTIEPAGFDVLLTPSGSPGSFTGSVATAVGPAANDGILQIAHGALIQASYFDASAGALRSATAEADLMAPVITGVFATNQFGTVVVSWTTDEPANSVVLFNTNSTLSRAATNLARVTFHAIELTNLVVGRTYRFAVSSTDAAGNTATNSNGSALFSITVTPAATVLLVDAYVSETIFGSPDIPLSSYTNALRQTGVSFDVWNRHQRGSPGLGVLQAYRAVIWRINDNGLLSFSPPPEYTLSAAEQTSITAYLRSGGAFFMASMEILTRGISPAFQANVLHVLTNAVDAMVPDIEGVASDPVTAGISMALDYSGYPDEPDLGLDPDISDTIVPTAEAVPVLFDQNSGAAAGLRFPRTGQDSMGRVVFLSFPLDAVPETEPDPNNRANLLRNILSFLVPGVNGLGTIALDNSAYAIPSLATAEVGDSDLIGAGQTTVTFYSDTEMNGRPITLRETVEPGLFRGFITLVPATNAPADGTLRVQDGDQIRAEYFDASGHGVVLATASVDAQPPAIANVVAFPDYEEATVSWDTTELADALVQFGESTFLGRTAYSADFDTSHELKLTGLQPDRIYYFQVVSRDVAGNTVTDPAGGTFYTFRTLQPLLPPLSDDFNSGATTWTTFSGEDSLASWTLGVPNNGVETAANSPPDAWGSNLNGNPVDTIDTFLISPAIELTGGNAALLRFSHSYDFTPRTELDLLEGGELLLIADGKVATLSEFFDENGGWEEETFDLTPYLGRVVFLVWHHQLLSFESAPRPGWLVDDVSVTVSTIVPGTIQISNNLSQARFVLTGPLSRSGQGMNTVITNAPPGDYTATFASVPYYDTPAAQMKTLAEGGALVFQGNYTFPDANHNGISDTWEQHYFPSSAPGADSDNDGVSDFAEFIAGTDPTVPDSKLRVTTPVMLADGAIRLEWPSLSGRAYRVKGSTNAVIWTDVTDWIRASSGTSNYILPPPAPGAPYLFRVEVHP